jgi:hypothetical protein
VNEPNDETMRPDPNYNKPPETNPGLAGNPDEPDPREQAEGWPPYEVPKDVQSRYKPNVASDAPEIDLDQPEPPLSRAETESLVMAIEPVALDAWDVLAKRERCRNPLCRGCQIDLMLIQAIVALSVQPDYSKMTMEQIYTHLLLLSFVDENGNSRGYIPPPGYDGVAEVRRRLRGGSGPHNPPGTDRVHQPRGKSAILDALKSMFGADVTVEEVRVPDSVGTGRDNPERPDVSSQEGYAKFVEMLRRKLGAAADDSMGHRAYSVGRKGGKTPHLDPSFVDLIMSRPEGMSYAQAARDHDDVCRPTSPETIVNLVHEASTLLRLAISAIVEGGPPSEPVWAGLSLLCDAGEDVEAALNRMRQD